MTDLTCIIITGCDGRLVQLHGPWRQAEISQYACVAKGVTYALYLTIVCNAMPYTVSYYAMLCLLPYHTMQCYALYLTVLCNAMPCNLPSYAMLCPVPCHPMSYYGVLS